MVTMVVPFVVLHYIVFGAAGGGLAALVWEPRQSRGVAQRAIAAERAADAGGGDDPVE